MYLFLEGGVLDAVDERVGDAVEEHCVHSEMVESPGERESHSTRVVQREVNLVPRPAQNEARAHLSVARFSVVHAWPVRMRVNLREVRVRTLSGGTGRGPGTNESSQRKLIRSL